MAAVHQQRLLLLCTSALHKTRKSMRSVPFGAWSKAKMSKLVFGHTFSPSKKRSDQFYKTATCMRGEEREQTQCLPLKTRFSQACSDSNAHRQNDRIHIPFSFAAATKETNAKPQLNSPFFGFDADLLRNTNEIGLCGGRQRRQRWHNILCSHREFCQKISVSIVFYNNSPFARTFVHFRHSPPESKTNIQ